MNVDQHRLIEFARLTQVSYYVVNEAKVAISCKFLRSSAFEVLWENRQR